MFKKRVITALLLLATPVLVLAANEVSVANSFTLVLPSDSSQYTVLGGTFDSVTVNNSSFDFSMSAGSSVDITSADKKNFSVSPSLGATTQCESSQSRIVLSKGQGASTETITVTPSGSCSSSGGGGAPGSVSTGGGGGGGSSASAPAPTPIPTPALVTAPAPTSVSVPASPTIASIQQQIAAIMARIASLRSGPAVPTAPPAYGVFARVMNPGERSDEVHRLQQLLAQDPSIYPEGTVSGYYGTLTRNAVRRFQLKHDVIRNADELGNGRVGPKTMAKLNEIFGGSPAPVLPSPVAPSPAVPPAAPSAPISNQAKINEIMLKIQEIQAKINALKVAP